MDGPYSNGRGQSFDYSADSGYGRAQTQRRGFRGTEENAKTKLCMRWLAGDCRFGPRCNFAHGEHELRKMPPRPGRLSQDTRVRELEREGRPSAYPHYGYGSMSYDGGYRAFEGHSSFYSENYAGNPFNRNHASGYHSGHMVAGPPSANGGYHSSGSGGGSGSGGPAPSLVQPSGPVHIAAASRGTSGEYYSEPSFRHDGPNGWTRYTDPKTGEPYYHNHITGITQWTRPEEWPMHQ